MVSWNVQRVSGGLSALISHLSELEDWAVLLQEISFTDESLYFEALEASLGGHKLVLNSSCPWDNVIVIHSRWKASLRWFASSCHSVWVGLRAAEEFTFCSIHLPSWMDDDTFEKSIEESLDAGRGRAGGSIFLGVDANCDVDNWPQPIVMCSSAGGDEILAPTLLEFDLAAGDVRISEVFRAALASRLRERFALFTCLSCEERRTIW